MIHIDRVEADVEVLRQPADAQPAPGAVPASLSLDTVTMDRLRAVVLEVLEDHLRDLERRGLL